MARSHTQGVPYWAPITFIAISLLALYILWDVLVIFLTAAFLAFLLHPVVELLDRRLPRLISVVIVYVALVAVLVLLGLLLLPLMVSQFNQFFESVPSLISQGRELFDSMQTRYLGLPPETQNIVDRSLEQVQTLAGALTRVAVPALVQTLSTLVALLIVPVLTFFMLLDYSGYSRMLLALMPTHARPSITDLMRQLDEALWAFIRGQSLLMLFVGTVTGVGLYLVGMPYPIVFGVIAGLLEVVPNFGPTITFIVVTIVGLLFSPFLALKAGAVAIGVQLLENSLLSPLVLATAVDLDPVTVALAILTGGALAGPAGILVSIPLAVMIKVILLYFYAQGTDVVPARKRCGGGTRRCTPTSQGMTPQGPAP